MLCDAPSLKRTAHNTVLWRKGNLNAFFTPINRLRPLEEEWNGKMAPNCKKLLSYILPV